MRRLLALIGFILLTSLSALAQTFNSGSTGADGALDTLAMNCPSSVCTVQLPESGVFNFTTVNISSGKELRFKRNSRNTPVIVLAQGNVTIGGLINVNAGSDPDNPSSHRAPGPGGFYGGDQNNGNGFGPGGGMFGPPSTQAMWVGPLSLVPLIGGSGGIGVCTAFNGCHYGGGGGGAIAIASSTTITVASVGQIVAIGNGDPSNYGGAGAGGAIRLVANSLNVAGTLEARGANLFGNNGGGTGVIRLEAPTGSLSFTGISNPPAVLSPINAVVVSITPPVLTIVSVGGFAVPSYAGQRFDTVDLLLPNQLTDPITVVVLGNNIPVGTSVSVGIVNGSPNATRTTSSLQGTFASSTASPTISNLNRTAVTYLLASATFDPPAGSGPSNQKGANYVDKVRLEALIGAKPKYIFLRKDGTVISPDNLRPEFLAQFGQ